MTRAKLPRRKFLHLASAAAVMSAAPQLARAQAFPSRPVTIIVPSTAGGPLDGSGRLVAERMREALGQPVLIENVAGAGGTLAVGRVARAAADGYTICIGNVSTHVFTGAMYTLRYHVADDFEPISPLTQ